jgi:predicted O-methyltransferase YrrM
VQTKSSNLTGDVHSTEFDLYTSVPYEDSKFAQSRILRRCFSCSGKFVGLQKLPHAFRSFATAINRKLFDTYPDAPFIPYDAATELLALLSKDQTVVEVGAGTSTTWLAKRVHRVTSYEWNKTWHEFVVREISSLGLSNVDLRYCVGHEEIAFDDIAPRSVDFGFIDGGPRSLCLVNLWPKLKPRGFVYLDNWDSDLFWLEGGVNAREFLRSCRHEIAKCRLFVDFAPSYVSVSEGLLVQKT